MSGALHAALEAAANRALALDPQRDAILAPLAGRSVVVQVEGVPALDTRVRFAGDGVTLEPAGAGAAADVTVRGTPQGLLALLGEGALPAAVQVTVRGDVGLLGRAREAAGRLRPDWREPLARVLGDEAGEALSRGLVQLVRLAARSARELGADAQEFLREESGLLADAEDRRDFGARVDALRDAVERLDKRIERLARARRPGAGE